jgi:hypothetical protein
MTTNTIRTFHHNILQGFCSLFIAMAIFGCDAPSENIQENTIDSQHSDTSGISKKKEEALMPPRDYSKAGALQIHGQLDEKFLDMHYPFVMEAKMDFGTVGAEPLDMKKNSGLHVSMLHNTKTFDEMYLCTHNKDLTLIDKYYLGKSTMFDSNSHTIEYKIIDDKSIEVHMVDFAYMPEKESIDTVNFERALLTINDKGYISAKKLKRN